MSPEQTRPRRHRRASHHSLNVSSACWLARLRTRGVSTLAGMHTQTYTVAGAAFTEGRHSLLCCFSLTCRIQSKTVSKSERRKKKGGENEGENDCTLIAEQIWLCAAVYKIKLPFFPPLLSDIILLLSDILGRSRQVYTEIYRKRRWQRALWAAHILHCQHIRASQCFSWKKKKKLMLYFKWWSWLLVKCHMLIK